MATDEKTEHTPARSVRLFCEAQSRASNVVHDLDDLDWIEASDEAVREKLQTMSDEAARVVALLLELSGSSSLLVCPTGMEEELSSPAPKGTLLSAHKPAERKGIHSQRAVLLWAKRLRADGCERSDPVWQAWDMAAARVLGHSTSGDAEILSMWLKLCRCCQVCSPGICSNAVQEVACEERCVCGEGKKS